MEEEVVVLHHRAARGSHPSGTVVAQSGARTAPSTLSRTAREGISEKRALGFVLALVLRFGARKMFVDLFEAWDAARDLIVEENRNDSPEADDYPKRSSRDRRPPNAEPHHEERRDEVACRLDAIQSKISGPDHSPVQFGLRFCENARGPSMASFECQSFSLSGKRLALASSIESPSPSIAACFEA